MAARAVEAEDDELRRLFAGLEGLDVEVGPAALGLLGVDEAEDDAELADEDTEDEAELDPSAAEVPVSPLVATVIENASTTTTASAMRKICPLGSFVLDTFDHPIATGQSPL